MKKEEEKATGISCTDGPVEKPLDQDYWNDRYQSNTTGWDLGQVSPPLKAYIDTVIDKNIKILIPGCGNTYEAEYLLEKGFTNITVIDIAPVLVDKLNGKFTGNTNIKVLLGDFFKHREKYDLILEQTFFCALPPPWRQRYVWKMHQLLSDNGILAGLLFNRAFDGGPPFGGDLAAYQLLFKDAFHFNKMETCYNSFPARANTELWIALKKNKNVCVNLYVFKGITCSGCKETVTEKFMELKPVLNVSINSTFDEVLVVSEKEVALEELQNQIAYDAKYSIEDFII